MQNAAAERSARGKVVINVQRIHIAGDLDEPPQIVLRERLREVDVLPKLEVVDARDFSRHG